MDDLEDELEAKGHSLDWLNEADFREAKTGLNPEDTAFKVLTELGESHAAMTAFRDHMQRPSKYDTVKDKLATFRMLIERLNNADRRLNGLQITATFETISAKVQDAVAVSCAEASVSGSLSTLCITVLKAVFATGGVEVEDNIDGNAVEVSMYPSWRLLPPRVPSPGGLARFSINYCTSSGGRFKKFKSMRVSDELFLGMSDTALQTPDLLCPAFVPRGNDGTPLTSVRKDLSKATAAQLLDWPLGSPYLEMKLTNPQQVTLTLSHLILQSGLFSDLGNTTGCRAAFVDKVFV